MPELPEVETIRRGLLPNIVQKRVVSTTIRAPRSVRSPLADFTRVLEGNSIKDIQRRGKLLVFHLAESSMILVIHLKMTGQLLYKQHPQKGGSEAGSESLVGGGHSFTVPEPSLPEKYTRIALTFEDGSSLFFNDIRRFGYWQLVSPAEFEKIESRYGIEPGNPNFTRENFVKIMSSQRSVKAVLLDQTKVAGLGNIYVDEACFRAGIHPSRPVKTLVKRELDHLYAAIQEIIATAIQHRGTTFRDYRDSTGESGNFKQLLNVYARAGEPCVQCGQPIQKEKHAGRGTHFCAHCQT